MYVVTRETRAKKADEKKSPEERRGWIAQTLEYTYDMREIRHQNMNQREHLRKETADTTGRKRDGAQRSARRLERGRKDEKMLAYRYRSLSRLRPMQSSLSVFLSRLVRIWSLLCCRWYRKASAELGAETRGKEGKGGRKQGGGKKTWQALSRFQTCKQGVTSHHISRCFWSAHCHSFPPAWHRSMTPMGATTYR